MTWWLLTANRRLDSVRFQSHPCADPERVGIMHLETRFLRLRTPVELGSRFGEWQVTWIGGWTKHRLSYIVMVAKIPEVKQNESDRHAATATGGRARSCG
jgi:hypothetical protein